MRPLLATHVHIDHVSRMPYLLAAGFKGPIYCSEASAPLLPAPQAPARADILVIASTHGDRLHESRKDCRQRLQAICKHAFGNRGTLLIPAFSIGRTQELLYEQEEIIHRNALKPAAQGVNWGDVDIVVDSPLAADFTAGYSQLKAHWVQEARSKLSAGRHPLAFEQLTTIPDHPTHLRTVAYLAQRARARPSSSPPAAPSPK